MPTDLCSKVYVGWTIWKTSFLYIVCISNVLNHLLCSIDIQHKLVNMDDNLVYNIVHLQTVHHHILIHTPMY